MEKPKLLVLIVILILKAIIAGLGIGCFWYKSKLDKLKLLVEKILLGQGQVSFDDRLKLENAVREINDPEIFGKWQKFTNSTSDSETQQNVGVLFLAIINKIAY
ncbi:MAG: hypothetical protein NTV36_01750 [Candidatus Staskawiczbacteria bacterium]|nr:hypothetical protein [Candidatus Staskawiczbacteria bacterium]